MSCIVYCPRPSDGARVICQGLGGRRRRDTWPGQTHPPRTGLVINWGSSHYPPWRRPNQRWLNRPESVAIAISKVQTYERLQQARIPTLDYTTDLGQVRRWLDGGGSVLARRDGQSGGLGIRILTGAERPSGNDNEDFFTKYFPKTHEYRVHVGPSSEGGLVEGRNDGVPGEGTSHPQSGEAVLQIGVIDLAQKKRSTHVGDSDSGRDIREAVQGNRTLHQRIVRSHDNGWIFAHQDLYLPDGLREHLSSTAIAAVRSLNLEFGAVDIAVRIRDNRDPVIKVLEVNTAPGLETTQTINSYLNSFRGLSQ